MSSWMPISASSIPSSTVVGSKFKSRLVSSGGFLLIHSKAKALEVMVKMVRVTKAMASMGSGNPDRHALRQSSAHPICPDHSSNIAVNSDSFPKSLVSLRAFASRSSRKPR